MFVCECEKCDRIHSIESHGGRAAAGGRCDVAFAAGLLRPGWAGCDAALAAGLAQPAIVWTRGVLECESGRKSMSVAAGVWWRDVLGGMIRGLGGYCSGGASREASSCGGKGLCLFASVRSVIEYKIRLDLYKCTIRMTY